MSGHVPDTDGAGGADKQAAQRAADRRRAAKLRQRREEAGQVRIQAWVPQERAEYARQVLHAAAAGANALPPDPGQQAELDAAKAEADALRVELHKAQAVSEQIRHEAQEQVVEAAAATTRAEAAEHGREDATRELATVRSEMEALQGHERAAQEASAVLRDELEGIRDRGGWRGVLLRLAGARPSKARA